MSRRLTEGEKWNKCENCGRYHIVQQWKHGARRLYCATCWVKLMPECDYCHKKATKRWSPDLDIKGFHMCADHEQEMMEDISLWWLSYNDKEINATFRKVLDDKMKAKHKS